MPSTKLAQAENGSAASDLSVKLKRRETEDLNKCHCLPSRCASKQQFLLTTGSSASQSLLPGSPNCGWKTTTLLLLDERPLQPFAP